MRYLLLLVLLTACQSQLPIKEIEQLELIPQAQSFLYQKGAGLDLEQNIHIYHEKDLAKEAQLLSEYLAFQGIAATIKPLVSGKEQGILLQKDSSIGKAEAYRIDCRNQQFIILAAHRAGVLHGIQSLRQILLAHWEKGLTLRIPAFKIEDQPQFAWRGLLLDCARHFMDKEFVKKYIDLLALHKMNRLHWHLTEDQGWRIEIKKYPKLTEIGAWREDGKGGKYGGFYTQEDIREIVAYAEARGVVVVPEIELPGHAQAALAAYPQHSCTGGPFEVETEWGVFKEIYCAGNDSTFLFLEDVLTEVLALFPSPYIHIGGDEVPKYRWEHCDRCQTRIKAEGLHDAHELQSYFIRRIQHFLSQHNRQLIGWDEILEGGLAPGAIVQSWRGFEGAKLAAQQGSQAIVSPTSHAYFDYGLNDIDLQKVYSFNPIPEGLSNSEAKFILGGECNMWSEHAPQEKVDGKVFPRILAMAEVLWTAPYLLDFADFKKRLATHYRRLDLLQVNYGLEAVPSKVNTIVKEQQLYAELQAYDSLQNMLVQVNGAAAISYKTSIKIEGPTQLIIHFERAGKRFEDSLVQNLVPHLAMGLTPKLSYEYHASYSAGGASGLCDGKKGSSHFRDGNWQGCWGDDMIVDIDLGKVQAIQSFSAGFLQYNNAWIFYPKLVEYWYSLDGKSYLKAGVVENKVSPKDKEQATQEFSLQLPQAQEARFLRMKAHTLGICPPWHDAAGSKAWLFLDEFGIRKQESGCRK